MSELERAKMEVKAALKEVLPMGDSKVAWTRKMVAVYYRNPVISPMWREIAEKSGALPLMKETLDKVLEATEFVTSNESDKKAIKRTLDSGTFLYHSDFARCLNLVLSGGIK